MLPLLPSCRCLHLMVRTLALTACFACPCLHTLRRDKMIDQPTYLQAKNLLQVRVIITGQLPLLGPVLPGIMLHAPLQYFGLQSHARSAYSLKPPMCSGDMVNPRPLPPCPAAVC